MLKYLLIIIFIPFFCSSFQDDKIILEIEDYPKFTEEQKQQKIRTIIDCIKNDNVDLLKTLVEYPLRRRYPLKSITSEEEFKSKYNEIFDDKLRSEIINSDVEHDWWETESYGLTLQSIHVGISLDGKLTVLPLSKAEEVKRDSLIEIDRDTIHKSIKKYKYPLLHMTTSKSNIRIYMMSDPRKCTLVIWDKDSSLSSKPKLIIEKGLFYYPPWSHAHFSFYNDPYKYELFTDKDGKYHGKPVEFITYKNDKVISKEPAIELND